MLTTRDAYHKWRDAKLAAYPANVEDLIVEIDDPRQLSGVEKNEIRQRCQSFNMAIFRIRTEVRDHQAIPRMVGEQFGLQRLDRNILSDDDGVTPIEVTQGTSDLRYPPYTNQELMWHTDGYYNLLENTIRAFILYCARPAPSGGENQLLDPDIVYLRLMEEEPAVVETLMQPDMYRIPSHVTRMSGELTTVQTSPVFALDPESRRLYIRYTDRLANISWRPDEQAKQAVEQVQSMIRRCDAYMFTYRLQSGEGLICNNILHNRAPFENGPGPEQQRLMYRARYLDHSI